jgi:hypothetical protein
MLLVEIVRRGLELRPEKAAAAQQRLEDRLETLLKAEDQDHVTERELLWHDDCPPGDCGRKLAEPELRTCPSE